MGCWDGEAREARKEERQVGVEGLGLLWEGLIVCGSEGFVIGFVFLISFCWH